MMNQLSENEHKVLCLPPKYTTFARINRVDVAEACQVMGHLTDPVVVVDPGQKKRQDVLAKTPYNEFTQ